jgi:UDP-N-acetylmuramate dehydrogenase
MKFAYRHSLVQETGDIVLSATFSLVSGNRRVILDQMHYLNALRRYKQPLDYPSCGSVFKRPAGHFVGPMIIQAGLQGKQIGGAQDSMKHAGFIINVGGATATDYLNLIHYIQKVVDAQFDVDLQTEVRIIGQEP